MDSDSGLSSPPSSLPSRDCSPVSSLGSARTPTPPPELRASFSSNVFSTFPKTRTVTHISLPSPPPSQDSSLNGSPAPDDSMVSDKDGPPPAKKRRVTPKERTTEHLNLRNSRVASSEQEQLDRLLHVLHKRRKIVVIAGAGISVSAGIPDFRSANGLFNTLKADYGLKGSGRDLFDATSVYSNETSTSSFHTMVSSMSRMTKDAKPTAFHHMLATLAHEGRLLRLYSQNVDGIDTSLEPLSTRIPLTKDEKGKWPKTVQLHGGLDKMVCSKCHALSDFDPDLFDGPMAPLCPNCETVDDLRTNFQGKRSHGIGRMRPRMVLYNEHNPDDIAIGKVSTEDMKRRPDAVIVVGTTLKVPGIQRIAREMCKIVRDRKDGMAIWINNDPPPTGQQFTDCWDIVVEGPADEVATRAALRRWDDPIQPEELGNISDEEVLKQADDKKASVVLSGKPVPKQLIDVPLPDGHINNSFRPPTIAMPQTPRRSRSPTRSPEFSPLTSRRPSAIQPSIEAGEIGDNIVVAESGLLTPSKSQKGTPPMPSIVEQLKDKPQQSKKGTAKKAAAPKKAPAKATKAAPPKKQSNVKYIKPAKSAAKATGKGAKQQKSLVGQGALTTTFSKSKGSAVPAATKEKDLAKPAVTRASPQKNPSKLSNVLNASSETLAPLSPSDARNNLSPTRSRSSLPTNMPSVDKNLQMEKRKTMSMANICN